MDDELDYEDVERELRPLKDEEIARMLRYEIEGNALVTGYCPACGKPSEKTVFGSHRRALVEAVRRQLDGTEPCETRLCERCAIDRCEKSGFDSDLDVGHVVRSKIVPGKRKGRTLFKSWSNWLRGRDVCYLEQNAIRELVDETGAIPVDEAEAAGWNRAMLVELCDGRTRLAEAVLEAASGEGPQETLDSVRGKSMADVERRERLDSISCHKVRFASIPRSETVTVAEIWAGGNEPAYLAMDGDKDVDEDEIMLLAHRSFPCLDEVECWATISLGEFCEEHAGLSDPDRWHYYPMTAEQLERALEKAIKEDGGEPV